MKEERVSLATCFSHQTTFEQDGSVSTHFRIFSLRSCAAVQVAPSWCFAQIVEHEGPLLNDVFCCAWEVLVGFWHIVVCVEWGNTGLCSRICWNWKKNTNVETFNLRRSILLTLFRLERFLPGVEWEFEIIFSCRSVCVFALLNESFSLKWKQLIILLRVVCVQNILLTKMYTWLNVIS